MRYAWGVAFAMALIVGAIALSVSVWRKHHSWYTYDFGHVYLSGGYHGGELIFSELDWRSGGPAIALLLPNSTALDVATATVADVEAAGFRRSVGLKDGVFGLEVRGGFASVSFGPRRFGADPVIERAGFGTYHGVDPPEFGVLLRPRSLTVRLPMRTGEAIEKLGAPVHISSSLILK